MVPQTYSLIRVVLGVTTLPSALLSIFHCGYRMRWWSERIFCTKNQLTKCRFSVTASLRCSLSSAGGGSTP